MKKCMLSALVGIVLAAAFFNSVWAIDQVMIGDDDIDSNEVITWVNTKEYVLTELVFAEAGSELHIEPGTVIKAKKGKTGLVICRHAKIYAMGTKEAPIIFTALGDDPHDSAQAYDRGRFKVGGGGFERGKWGGICILGTAPISEDTRGWHYVDGIFGPSDPVVARARFGGGDQEGGADPEDSSGVFKYVSIRFGGHETSANNELNGLTLAGVGSRTVVHHVEVLNNLDDGFEFFGGTVNTRYLVSAFSGDDAFDYDFGYRGRNQYWVVLSSNDGSEIGFAMECSGSPVGDIGSKPFSIPIISNVTIIGAEDMGFDFKENAGGKLFAGVITDQENGIKIAPYGVNTGSEVNSRQRWIEGDLFLKDWVWHNVPTGSSPDDPFCNEWCQGNHDGGYALVRDQRYADSLIRWNNTRQLPMFNLIYDNLHMRPWWVPIIKVNGEPYSSRVDLRPRAESPLVLDSVYTKAFDADTSGFIEPTTYIGAFSPYESQWLHGWTALSHYGFLEPDTGWVIDPELEPILTGTIRDLHKKRIDAEAVAGVAFTRNAHAYMRYFLPQTRHVTVQLFSMRGKCIASVYDGRKTAGTHTQSVSISSLAEGCYIFRVKAGETSITRKLQVVR